MSGTISEKQLRRFYFPAWNACAKANGWVMRRGRLGTAQQHRPTEMELTGADLVDNLRKRVWVAAEQIALQGHRAVTAEDLRHGCTIVALSAAGRTLPDGRGSVGRAIYKSSKDLTNGELDRVVCLFRLLTDADDVGAMMDWQAPERGERKRVIWAIGKSAPEAYIARIASDKFGTELWEQLGIVELRQLLMTLKGRQRKWATEFEQKETKETKAETATMNCPF